MDQRNENETPQEVVLRYEPHPVQIVERYVQPTPLPGRCAQNQVPPRRRRKGLRAFLICLAVLLVSAGGITAWWLLSGEDASGDVLSGGRYRDDRFEYRSGELRSDTTSEKTTIRRAPHTDEVQLLYETDVGDALSAQEIYRKVNPSTVTILTGKRDGSVLIGTGVIITEDGYILTNAHVIAGGSECCAVLDTGEQYNARLLGLDEEKDLAVIKVEAAGLPAAEFGDSDALSVGDTVYAIGNPLGVELRGTLTDGIISAVNRSVSVDGTTMTLIQTNAALNSGNSGGPLINVYGQVVGINTMKMGSSSAARVEGLGFAIPISSAAYMVNDLIAYGEIRGEAMLGITVSTQAKTLSDGSSALSVIELVPDGPGDKAGIQLGDLIVTADGEPLTSSTDLIRVRRRHSAGETVSLLVERDGRRFTVDVVLERINE